MEITRVAAYDVSDDGRRSRLAAVLQSHGDRIQKSVFLLGADDDEVKKIMERSTAIVDVNKDSVWILRQCASCWQGALRVGQAEPPHRTLYWAVM